MTDDVLLSSAHPTRIMERWYKITGAELPDLWPKNRVGPWSLRWILSFERTAPFVMVPSRAILNFDWLLENVEGRWAVQAKTVKKLVWTDVHAGKRLIDPRIKSIREPVWHVFLEDEADRIMFTIHLEKPDGSEA